VLPNTCHADTSTVQPSANKPISLTIAKNLRFPECSVGLGKVTTGWAAMPKAAIDENSGSVLREIKVWPSWQDRFVHSPSCDPGTHESHSQTVISGTIVLRSNLRHDARTAWFHIMEFPMGQFVFEYSFHDGVLLVLGSLVEPFPNLLRVAILQKTSWVQLSLGTSSQALL